MSSSTSSTSNPKLKLKSILDSGKTAYGTFNFLRGGRVAQVVAHTGLDAVVIDTEHGECLSEVPRVRGMQRGHTVIVILARSGYYEDRLRTLVWS